MNENPVVAGSGLEVYSDPDKQLYKTLELKNGIVATLFQRQGFKAYSHAKEQGFKPKMAYRGDPFQLGGCFVARADGSRFMFFAKAKDSSFHTPVDEILATLA